MKQFAKILQEKKFLTLKYKINTCTKQYLIFFVTRCCLIKHGYLFLPHNALLYYKQIANQHDFIALHLLRPCMDCCVFTLNNKKTFNSIYIKNIKNNFQG